MKSSRRELLSKIAWQIPIAAMAAYGIVGTVYYGHQAQGVIPDSQITRHLLENFKMASENSRTIAEVSLAYALAMDVVSRARANIDKRRHENENKLIEQATTLRPPPANLGIMVTEEYFGMTQGEIEKENARKILQKTRIFRKITDVEKKSLNLKKSQHVFATSNHIILINPGNERDLIKASAARGTLTNEKTGKNLPLFKPVAIKMAVEMGQYLDEDIARDKWDEVYDEIHGKKLLRETLLDFSKNKEPIAVIMDGRLALDRRKGTVLPWGDYRYIGFEKLVGIETAEDAAYAAVMIAKTGIRDADKNIEVRLRSDEIKRLARSIYVNAIKEREEQRVSLRAREIMDNILVTSEMNKSQVKKEEEHQEYPGFFPVDDIVDQAIDRENVELEEEMTTKGIKDENEDNNNDDEKVTNIPIKTRKR